MGIQEFGIEAKFFSRFKTCDTRQIWHYIGIEEGKFIEQSVQWKEFFTLKKTKQILCLFWCKSW